MEGFIPWDLVSTCLPLFLLPADGMGYVVQIDIRNGIIIKIILKTH